VKREAAEPESPLLTVEEAARYLRISRPMVYRLLQTKQLRPVKIGSRTLFDKKDLDRFIEESKEERP